MRSEGGDPTNHVIRIESAAGAESRQMAPLERDAWLRQIEDDILTDWGRRVRAARGPLSQERLAAIVGYDQRTISKIENGKTNPSIRLKWLIAGALGRTIDELFPNPSIRPPFPGGGTEGRI